jgi:hypothetical protein
VTALAVTTKQKSKTTLMKTQPIGEIIAKRMLANRGVLTSKEQVFLVLIAIDKNVERMVSVLIKSSAAATVNNGYVPFATYVGFAHVYKDIMPSARVAMVLCQSLRIFNKLGLITSLDDKTGHITFDKTLWSDEEQKDLEADKSSYILDSESVAELDRVWETDSNIRELYRIAFFDGLEKPSMVE